MSHVASIDIEVSDLAALKAACERAGWTFLENKKTYKWYGTWVNDYHGQDAAYKNGIDPKNYGKCDHAIKVPDCEYEIGLVSKGNGKFAAIFDFYDGVLMAAVGGQNAPKLLQLYGVEKTKRECMKRGYYVTEHKKEDGTIKLMISGKF